MKEIFDKVKDYFKDLTTVGKVLWIIAIAALILLIILLIVGAIKKSKLKKKLYKDQLTKGHNYTYFVNKMSKKYNPKKYSLAIVDFKDNNNLRDTYDRSLYKEIIVSFYNTIKHSINKKDLFARSEYNEFIIATKKSKKINLESYYNNIKDKLNNLIVKGNPMLNLYNLSYNEGYGDDLLVELNRIVICNNTDSLNEQVKPEIIEENREYLSLSDVIKNHLEKMDFNLEFIPFIDIKNSKLKMSLCGMNINGQSSFENTFKDALTRENLAINYIESLISKLNDGYTDELQNDFVIEVSPSFTDDTVSLLDTRFTDLHIKKEHLIIACSQENYYNKSITNQILIWKSLGYKIAILGLDETLDFNALFDFNLVTISNKVLTRLKNEENKKSYQAFFNSSKSDIAVEVNSNEDINLLKEIDVKPLIYSTSYFKTFSIEELVTITRIQNLLNLEEHDASLLEEFEKNYAPKVIAKEIVSESPEEKDIVEDEAEDSEDDDVDNAESLEVENEKKFPTIKSIPFPVRISAASDDAKMFFKELNDKLAEYKGVRNQIGKSGETFRYKNKTCACIRLVGKTIRLYLDLNPDNYAITRFHQKNVSDIKRYVRTPMMVKIRSTTALKKAKFLIDEMAFIYAMNKNENPQIDAFQDIKNWLIINK